MKRLVLFASLLLCISCATSCGIANSLGQTAGRMVQAAGRTVGY